jgi:hypothetical protein
MDHVDPHEFDRLLCGLRSEGVSLYALALVDALEVEG